MSEFRRLVREIHSRSLWQVLGLYVVGSWIALQVVETLSETVGLPEWFGPVAFGLLIVGLPIVVATAFVQEGAGRDSGSAAAPAGSGSAETEGTAKTEGTEEAAVAARDVSAETSVSSSGPSPGTKAPSPLRPAARHRLLTWRNAILGGVAAFALLGLVTAGWMAMRTLGIGPAGTLVAKGVIEEGVDVVLAEFESPDPELADVVAGALRIDLVESPVLRLVPRSELAEALARMARAEDAAITGELARELAVREGYGAVIEGDVGTAGSGYVLTASILGGEGWEPLAGFRATARSEDELIDAIEKLSRDIREKAGESLRSVRSAPPLDQVTTASLEALRTYTRADQLASEGNERGALELYERAVALDSAFAMAYRKIAVVLGNLGIRREDQVAALRRAFQLRARLPERERLHAEAYYHLEATGDRDAVIRSYEALLEVDPEDLAALNNLALVYRHRGRLEESEALLERAVAVRPFAVAFQNLALTRARMGRPGAAEAALDSGIARLPGAAWLLEEIRAELAASRAEYAAAESLAAAYAARFRSPEGVAAAARLRFRLDAVRGRLRAAEASLEEFDAAPHFWANPMGLAFLRSGLELMRGDSARAARIALETHEAVRDSLPPGDRRYFLTIETLEKAGRSAEAERLFREWRDRVPDDEIGELGRDDRRGTGARLAFARGERETAVRLWEGHRRECAGLPPCVLGAALGLARIHEAAGNVAGAIAEYERFLAEPFANRAWADAMNRGPVLDRLAQLYDETGDLENAARYYAQFVELWADADPELRPRVEAAQARLEAIVAERG